MNDNGRNMRGWYAAHRQAMHAVLIVAVGCVAYCGAFGAPFYFDDHQCIVNNHVVQHFGAILELDRFREFGISEDIRNNLVTRFVTYLTFAANFRLHGLHVGGYHAVNLVVHLANALLVYKLVRMTPGTAGAPTTTSETVSRRPDLAPLALASALVFVSHPIETSAVTYIVQRFASLATFFCLVSLVSYVHAATAATTSRRRRSYLTALLALLTAMYTKEIAFTFPVVIALYDIVFLEGSARARIRRLAPLFATMLFLPLTVAYLSSLSGVTAGKVAQSLNLVNFGRISSWHYFVTQLRVIITYLRLLVFPTKLNLDYDYPLYTSLSEPQPLASGILLALLAALGVFLFVRARRPSTSPERLTMKIVAFGIFWFFITLAMESSFIPLEDLIYEYRLYLPSVGFFFAICAAGAAFRRRVAERVPRGDRVLVPLVALIVASLTLATFARNRLWSDETAFWEDVVRKTPEKARPRWNLADAYIKSGRVDEAIGQCQMAKMLKPLNGQSPYELGLLFHTLGRYDEAIAEFRIALSFQPEMATIHTALGRSLLLRGLIDEAGTAFRTALSFDPANREARDQLSLILDIPPLLPQATFSGRENTEQEYTERAYSRGT